MENNIRPKVIYLTGASAAGKSTLTTALKDAHNDILIFEYGKELTEFLRIKNQNNIDQSQVRTESAQIVSSKDIEQLDSRLIALVRKERRHRTIIIDSHPVTKERYGYRVTAFSLKMLLSLKPDNIFVLYTDPETTIKRIKASPAGRPLVNPFEAGFHTSLQASVAIAYGISLSLCISLIPTRHWNNLPTKS